MLTKFSWSRTDVFHFLTLKSVDVFTTPLWGAKILLKITPNFSTGCKSSSHSSASPFPRQHWRHAQLDKGPSSSASKNQVKSKINQVPEIPHFSAQSLSLQALSLLFPVTVKRHVTPPTFFSSFYSFGKRKLFICYWKDFFLPATLVHLMLFWFLILFHIMKGS